MTQGRRLAPLPECPIDRGKAVRLQFEGRSIDGFSNEPIAIALLAAGIQVFGRSIKYHRPRGPMCLRGHCSGCLMRVDGVPNVRTCETLCKSGQVVERQIGWPSSGFDLLRGIDLFSGDRLDHQAMFTSSATVNRMAARVVRHMAGLGDPPTADIPEAAEVNRFRSRVVVIGGGAAGLSAALTLAESGHKVLLFESNAHRGGRLLDGSISLGSSAGQAQSGWEHYQQWKSRWQATQDMEIHVNTPVLSVFAGERFEVLAANAGQTFVVEADRLVICTGAYEQIPLFVNNDLPGLFGIRALDLLFSVHGVVPAEPVVIVGDSDRALRLAQIMNQRGVALSGVVTDRSSGQAIEALRDEKIPLFMGHNVVKARGSRWLDRIELAKNPGGEPDLVLDCRVCALEGFKAPAYELAHHAGCRVVFDSARGYTVAVDEENRTSHGHVFAAGHCCGTPSTELAIVDGERAGLACALSLEDKPELTKRLDNLRR